MESTLTQSTTDPGDGPGKAVVAAWSKKHMDTEVLAEEVRNTWNQNKTIENERFAYREEHRWEGNAVFHCRGGVYILCDVHNASQTSLAVREDVAALRKGDNRVDVGCIVRDDVEPYLVDRIVDFWTTTGLHIGKQKVTERARYANMDPAAIDVTTSLSTFRVCYEIYLLAEDLRDEHLKAATLARARHHILSKFLSALELLEMLDLVYGIDTPTHATRIFKKKFLSGLVKKGWSILTGPQLSYAEMLSKKHQEFYRDSIWGHMYYAEIFGHEDPDTTMAHMEEDGQGTEDKDKVQQDGGNGGNGDN